MYTIKIVIFKNSEKEEPLKEETFYVEGSDLKVRRFYPENEQEKTNEDLAKKVFENFISEPGVWFVNKENDQVGILVIGYFDKNGEYRNIVLCNKAIVYILQNGKTIDTIRI